MTTKFFWRGVLTLCLASGLMLAGAGCQQRGTTHTPGPESPKKSDTDKKPDKQGQQQPKPDPG